MPNRCTTHHIEPPTTHSPCSDAMAGCTHRKIKKALQRLANVHDAITESIGEDLREPSMEDIIRHRNTMCSPQAVFRCTTSHGMQTRMITTCPARTVEWQATPSSH